MTAQNTNTMTVVVGIDQRECIRNGIVADSTAKITLDLGAIPAPIRNWIADRFWSGELRVGGSGSRQMVQLCDPTPGALIELATQEIERDRQSEARQWAAAQDVMAKAPQIHTRFARWDTQSNSLDIQTNRGSCLPRMEVSYPVLCTYPFGFNPGELSPEHYQAWNQWVQKSDEANDAALKAALEAIMPQLRKQAAEWDAEQERLRAEKERLAEELRSQLQKAVETAGPVAVARWKEGYLPEEEAIGLAIKQELASRGLTYSGSVTDWGYDEAEEIKSIDDNQYERLRSWRQKLPESAQVNIFRLDRSNDESPAGVDSIVVAEAVWLAGRIQVTADTAL